MGYPAWVRGGQTRANTLTGCPQVPGAQSHAEHELDGGVDFPPFHPLFPKTQHSVKPVDALAGLRQHHPGVRP